MDIGRCFRIIIDSANTVNFRYEETINKMYILKQKTLVNDMQVFIDCLPCFFAKFVKLNSQNIKKENKCATEPRSESRVAGKGS